MHAPLPPSYSLPPSRTPPSPSRPSSSTSSPSPPPALPTRSKDVFAPRPTHRRYPASYRHNPLHPLRPRPINPPPSSPSSSPPRSVPFLITRTPSQHLPVYLSLRGGGTLPLTCIRRVEGNLQALAEEVRRALGPSADVRVRAGRVEVKGNWKKALEEWLTTLGF